MLCQRDCLHPTFGFSEQHPLRVQALDFSPECDFSQAISRMLHEPVVSSFFFFFFSWLGTCIINAGKSNDVSNIFVSLESL